MSRFQGPSLEELVHRLRQTPESFLAKPRIKGRGRIYVSAVVADCLAALGGERLYGGKVTAWQSQKPKRQNEFRQVLIACWLLYHPWFREAGRFAKAATEFLKNGLDKTARLVDAKLFVTEPDRQEELVRLTLDALGLRPKGETTAQAADRLTTVSSVERERVINESRAQQKRATNVREAMARKAAVEAAARYGRE